MNKTAIKNFAVWARRKLISEITYKAGLLGVTEKGAAEPLPQSTKDLQFFDIGTKTYAEVQGVEIAQRNALVAAIRDKAREVDYKTAFQNVVEEVAYTWFNRMIAIRFMEINDYLPSRVRVLSSENPGKLEPDFVTNPFDTDLDFTPYERDRVLQFKDENKLDELFRALFIKQCNKLHEILPELFEATRDYTELLLTISFTDKDGVVYHLTHDIPESDFDISHTDEDGKTPGQVEIIGWMYQYYNTEPKDEVFALLKKNVKITKERIPAATQLFTPDWIVRYMVENSLGRLWVEGHPNDALKAGWKYYLEEAEQEPDVQAQLAKLREDYARLNPEDIKVIDPCMGSGHILVYAFDVLMQIYEAQGYTQRDAARLIVEKNLYGLDIDKRAYQLAYFAVMMKARQYNRRILNGEIRPNLYVIDDSAAMKCDVLDFIANGNQKMRTDLQSIADDLTNAKEYGSIINVAPVDFDALFTRFEAIRTEVHMLRDYATNFVLPLVRQAQIVAQKYDVVVTNPPYMSMSNANPTLSQYVVEKFPDCKADMYAVFIQKCGSFAKPYGLFSLITMHSWMFLSSFTALRKKLSLTSEIINMVHLGMHAFSNDVGTIVQTSAFVYRKSCQNANGLYIDLTAMTSPGEKKQAFLISKTSFSNCFAAKYALFKELPGEILAYWASPAAALAFSHHRKIENVSETRIGMATADNDRFMRFWFEPSFAKASLSATSRKCAKDGGKKWFPYAKGGTFRKWYGNMLHFVNWENDGFEIQHFIDEKTGRVRSHNYNLDFIFKPGFTFTAISNDFSCRIMRNALFGSGGSGICSIEDKNYWGLLGLLNSKLILYFMRMLSQTMNFEVNQVGSVPFFDTINTTQVTCFVKENVELSQDDWNAYENSWDFKRNPLV